MHFTVYQWPDGKDPNQLSGVLLLRYQNASILLTGDLSGDGEKWLARTYGDAVHTDILKAPHHGYLRMTSEFLHTVNPEFVFVTNKYSVTQKLDRQLDKEGIPYMHHTRGTIVMETDGTDWYVTQNPGMI